MPEFFTQFAKPEQGMSLGDIVNLARGVQSYQQAQQANPLAIQRAQMEIEQLQKINPLAERKAQAETGTAELGFSQAQKKAPLELQQTEQATEKGRLELAGQNQKQFQNVMGGFATDKRMLDAVARNDVKAAQKLLSEGVSQLLTSGFNSPSFLQGAAEMMDYAQKDLKNLPAKLNTLNLQAVSPETRVTAQTGGVVEINGVKYQFNPTTKALTPIGEEVAPAAAPAAPAAPAAAPAIAPQRGGLVPLDMPVSGKVPQLNTQQQDRYKFGEALMRDSAQLAQAAGDSRQTIRQIKQNISQAAGSKPEQLVRNAGRWIGGNEELDELLKSLADNQMRQAQMMGVGTDAARSTVATASGSADISAGALNMIANRADAMNTAFEKFNKGLSAFKQKHKINGSIHADNFKQAWAQNYDPLVFLVQNINASDLTPAEKQMELQKLLKGTSEQQRKELARKAENIKRLEKGDF